MDVVNRIRLLLSAAISDYQIKPTMNDSGFVVFVEVKPVQISKAKAILPKKMDGIDIVIVSSLL